MNGLKKKLKKLRGEICVGGVCECTMDDLDMSEQEKKDYMTSRMLTEGTSRLSVLREARFRGEVSPPVLTLQHPVEPTHTELTENVRGEKLWADLEKVLATTKGKNALQSFLTLWLHG